MIRAFLSSLLLLGCSGVQLSEQPIVVHRLEGSGVLELEIVPLLLDLELEWREQLFDVEGEQVHCSTLQTLAVNGFDLASRQVLSSLSDPRCSFLLGEESEEEEDPRSPYPILETREQAAPAPDT